MMAGFGEILIWRYFVIWERWKFGNAEVLEVVEILGIWKFESFTNFRTLENRTSRNL